MRNSSILAQACLLAMGIFVACSDDTSSSGDDDDDDGTGGTGGGTGGSGAGMNTATFTMAGGGGSGGEPVGGGGNTTTTTGTNTVTMTMTMTMTSELCAAEPGDTACIECAKEMCCAEATACDADPTCAICLDCVAAGNDPLTCVGMGECDPNNPATLTAYMCLSASCPACSG